MANKPKLSPTDWANVVVAYQSGEKNMVELAEEYGVTHQAISKGLRERGIRRVSELTENIVNEEDQARKQREEDVAKARQQVERFSKFNDVITQMVMKRVIDGDRDGTLRAYDGEIKVLNNASKVVERARRENWTILEIEKVLEGEESLPDLNVGEYTPEELESIRQANEDNYLEGQAGDGEEYDDYSFASDEDGDE